MDDMNYLNKYTYLKDLKEFKILKILENAKEHNDKIFGVINL